MADLDQDGKIFVGKRVKPEYPTLHYGNRHGLVTGDRHASAHFAALVRLVIPARPPGSALRAVRVQAPAGARNP